KEIRMFDKNLLNSISSTQDSCNIIIKVGKKLPVEELTPIKNSNNNNPFRDKEFLSEIYNQNYKEFHVHSSILLKDIKSKYFYNALSNFTNNNDLKSTEKCMIKENQIIVLELPDINPTIFEVILEFVYNGNLDINNFTAQEIVSLLFASSYLDLKNLTSRLFTTHFTKIIHALNTSYSTINHFDETIYSQKIDQRRYIINHLCLEYSSVIFGNDSKNVLSKIKENQINEAIYYNQTGGPKFGKSDLYLVNISSQENLSEIIDGFRDIKRIMGNGEWGIMGIRHGKLSIEKNKISFVDVFIASDELELMEVCQQIEERLLENESAWKLPIDYITICQYENFTKLNDVALALVCRKPLVMFESKEFLRMEENVKLAENSPLLSYNNEIYNNYKCEISTSFIFSLTNRAIPILSRVSSRKEAIIWCGDKGPCFGLQDLWIQNGSLPHIIVGKCKQRSYEKKIIDRETFEIEEYEVFQIIDNRNYFLNFIGSIFGFIARVIRDILS
ncbi:21177_t:CDS:2, partial [Rhizophagus irregularis]